MTAPSGPRTSLPWPATPSPSSSSTSAGRSPGTPSSLSSTWCPRPGSRPTPSTPANTTPSCSAGSPGSGGKPPLYTSLSYDVIAHEVSHAILDGLRPRYTEPGLPDQLAFHEALADLVALMSVFSIKGVAQHLLDPEKQGEVRFPSDALARRIEDPDEQQKQLLAGRAEMLKTSPLARLAEQIGGRRAAQHPATPPCRGVTPRCAGRSTSPRPRAGRPTRRTPSRTVVPRSSWRRSCRRSSPCGRAGSTPLRQERRGGLDAGRVAEEGVKSAKHLLAMLLRALDYLPPIELEFADVIDSVLTADRRLAPDDDHDYRDSCSAPSRPSGSPPPAASDRRRGRHGRRLVRRHSRGTGRGPAGRRRLLPGSRRHQDGRPAVRAPQPRRVAHLARGGLPVHLEQRRRA